MRFGRLGAGAAISVGVFLVSGVLNVGCSNASKDGSANDGHLGVKSEPIQGGSLDGTAHPFAVGVCIGSSPGNCDSFCSGTLITPNLVVTARHCVDQVPFEAGTGKDLPINCADKPRFLGRFSSLFVTTNSTMKPSASGWHTVDMPTIVTTADDHICGHDIALLTLTALVPSAEATPAIPGVQYNMGDINRYVHRYTAVGFGNTAPTGFSAGTRHLRASIPVDCIPGDDFIPCTAVLPAGVIDDNEFFTGDGTCGGDSGSGAYEDHSFQMNMPVSFGVLSRGTDNADPDAGTPATLCKFGFYTRLDKYRDLVLQAATSASNNWSLYPKPVPDWTVFVPPPPDAGAPEAGPPKPPKPRADGVACDTNDQCTSKVCADTGAGKACTTSCVESVMPTTCPDGFYCKGVVCVQGTAPVAPPSGATAETTTTSGCAVGHFSARATSSDGMLGLLGAAILGLGLRRRKVKAAA